MTPATQQWWGSPSPSPRPNRRGARVRWGRTNGSPPAAIPLCSPPPGSKGPPTFRKRQVPLSRGGAKSEPLLSRGGMLRASPRRLR
ncbi:uncharacterized protein CANTADRAFT_278194 [Suhomyces tanzawaensis NRRL Y-17324]|uniref:Uncharacterized protein n=1 Tax=Suhomyces tanzawaensis NRRL Y-17324 TaxID=984487 RepID=A0A1E4SH55_9ASCO|nr:uncharacterized protein CANTADRAFT_278194 [Suhomyces tanzawaensis NRRL Y-17324]ODV78826.1 hypothetical protein CANTADRAFT_278194 [Suhomyces tanzawaensis NRRL Y-17324]